MEISLRGRPFVGKGSLRAMRILDKDRFRRFTGVQLADLVLISEDYLDFCIESIDILHLGWIWLGIWLLTFLNAIAFFRRNEATTQDGKVPRQSKEYDRQA